MYFDKYIKYKKKYMELQKYHIRDKENISNKNLTNYDSIFNDTTDNFLNLTNYLNIRELINYCIDFKIKINQFHKIISIKNIIDFASVHNISNNNFQKIFLSTKLELALNIITFENNTNITIENIDFFIKKCPRLETLKIINSGIYSNEYEDIDVFEIHRIIYSIHYNIQNLCIIDERNIGNDILESISKNTELVNLYLSFNIDDSYFDNYNNFDYVFHLIIKIIFINKKLKYIYLPSFNYTDRNSFYKIDNILKFINLLMQRLGITSNFDFNNLFNIPLRKPTLKKQYKFDSNQYNLPENLPNFNITNLDPKDLHIFNQIRQSEYANYLRTPNFI
jgi:hypothetical protein